MPASSPDAKLRALLEEKLAFLREEEAVEADATAKFKLKKEIDKIKARLGPATPDAPPETFGLPSLIDDVFVGRDDELVRLHDSLTPQHAVALTPAACRVAAHGGGGIGKTRLAVEYAWRHLEAYPGGVFFGVVDERTPLEVWADLGRQADERELTDNTAAATALDAYLRRARGRVLVIFDDVAGDAARFAGTFELAGRRVPVLPSAERVSVLVTTRLSEVAGTSPWPVERLDVDGALRLLDRRSGRDPASLDEGEASAARELADTVLGGHALALSLAGAYLKRVPSVGFADYLEKLRQRGLTETLEETADHVGCAVTDHDRSIVGTFKLSHDLLDPDDAVDRRARELLAVVSLLAPGVAVDRRLLYRLLSASDADVTAEDVDLAVARLLDISLLIPDRATDVKVHALVADYVRWGLPSGESGRLCGVALGAVNALFPRDMAEHSWKILTPGGATDWEPLTGPRQQHVVSLVTHGARLSEDLDSAGWMRDLSLSQDNLGAVLLAQCDLPGALVEFRAARRLAQKDPDNAVWMRVLSVSHGKIGAVLFTQCDVPGA